MVWCMLHVLFSGVRGRNGGCGELGPHSVDTFICPLTNQNALLQISTKANQDQHAPVARVPLLVLSVRFSDTPIHASGRPHHMCIPLLYCSVASARKVWYSSLFCHGERMKIIPTTITLLYLPPT